MAEPLYPYRFAPIYKDYMWGGDKIVRTYNRPESPGIYAESWEVADRPEGMSTVANGPLAGTTLNELVLSMKTRLLGPAHDGEVFPLLIKLIDSRQRLSVQVHPDDSAAHRFGGEAKTEMWYVLDAERYAQVFAGFKPRVNRDAFETAMKVKMFEEVLQAVPVKEGDAIFIPGGRVHAIDAGLLLLEIQQNSNTTYRIYDWDRLGPDGKPRPLHLEQAMQVIRWNDCDDPRVATRRLDITGPNEEWEILTTPYFRMVKLVIAEPWLLLTHYASFHILFVAEGRFHIKTNGLVEDMPAGSTCLIPAALSSYEAVPVGGPGTLLRITASGLTG